MSSLDQNIIEEKLAEVEKNFNSVEAQIKKIEIEEQTLAQKKAELNVELFRFQGEHRLLTSLKVKKEAVVESLPEETKQ